MAHDFTQRSLRVGGKVFKSQKDYDAFVTEEEGSVDATPDAEALAEEHGILLSEIEGSGKDGRILKSDVQAVIDEE